ncbi:MAG: hypothetical protein WC683_18740 [bacterium]
MSIKITTGTQRQALQSVMRCIRDRKAVPKGEADFVLAQLEALDDRLRRFQETEYARERQREARDAAEVMGGGD